MEVCRALLPAPRCCSAGVGDYAPGAVGTRPGCADRFDAVPVRTIRAAHRTHAV